MCVHGLDLKNIGLHEVDINDLDILLMLLTAPAVNCFIFISGYYGIKFSFGKITRLTIQAWIVFCCIIILRNGFNLCGGPESALRILQHLLPVSMKAWWFLTEYVTLMLLAPFLNKGISEMDKQTYKSILLLIGFISSVGLYISRSHTGSDLLGFIFLYLLGRYLNKYNWQLTKRCSLILFFVSTAILFLLSKLCLYANMPRIIFVLQNYCNPLMIIQAVCIFYFFQSFKPFYNSFANWVGQRCLTIYLFTEWTSSYYYKIWAESYKHNSLIVTLFEIMFICILIMIADFGLQKVYDCLLKQFPIKSKVFTR